MVAERTGFHPKVLVFLLHVIGHVSALRGQARIGMPVQSFKDVTTLTMYWPDSDNLAPEHMLPHQIDAMSNNASSFRNIVLQPKGWTVSPETLQVANVQTFDVEQGLSDETLFHRYFSGQNSNGHTLSNLHDLFREHGVSPHASNTLGHLVALELCETQYCVWMDPDIFVHREEGKEGWLDVALRNFEEHPDVAIITAPGLVYREHDGEGLCQLDTYPWFSSRAFIVDKQRLMQHLPVEVDCAPLCNTFETFFMFPTNTMAALTCGEGAWHIHPPDDVEDLKAILMSCDPAKPSSSETLNVQAAVPELWARVASQGHRMLVEPDLNISEHVSQYNTMQQAGHFWSCS